MLDQSLVSGKSFRDDKNFPHGFSRSGNFSRSESDLLTQAGSVATAIADGSLEPSSKAQKQLLAVCRGECDPQSEFERVWLKYVDAVGSKRFVFGFASSGNLASNEGRRMYANDFLG